MSVIGGKVGDGCYDDCFVVDLVRFVFSFFVLNDGELDLVVLVVGWNYEFGRRCGRGWFGLVNGLGIWVRGGCGVLIDIIKFDFGLFCDCWNCFGLVSFDCDYICFVFIVFCCSVYYDVGVMVIFVFFNYYFDCFFCVLVVLVIYVWIGFYLVVDKLYIVFWLDCGCGGICCVVVGVLFFNLVIINS